MYRKISIRIDDELYRQVVAHTITMDCTITDVTLEAMREFFKKQPVEQPEPKEEG